jgi:hypothetical protein
MDMRVLDFDHVSGEKVSTIGKMLQENISWAKIHAEIEKCNVLCANCHRKRTYQQMGYYKCLELIGDSINNYLQ